MSKFSDWLNEQLTTKKVKSTQLAKGIGLSYAAVYSLTRELRNPGPETVVKIANYFEIDPDWLLALADHRKPSINNQSPKEQENVNSSKGG
jgi:plasmid maintenance system antidote protein VapI